MRSCLAWLFLWVGVAAAHAQLTPNGIPLPSLAGTEEVDCQPAQTNPLTSPIFTTCTTKQISQIVTGVTNTWGPLQTFDGGIQISPSGLGRGFNVGQSPSGSSSANQFYNNINVSLDNAVLSPSSTTGYGLRSVINIGPSATGSRSALKGEIDILGAVNLGGGDAIGGTLVSFGAANAGGTNTSSGAAGTMFGCSCFADLENGATNYLIATGGEFLSIINGTASASIRFGLTIASGGSNHAATYDAGIGFYSYSTTGYQFGLEFTNIQGGNAPLSSTATVIGTDGSSNTVTNFADFHTWTFMGNIFNFPNFIVDASGNTQIGGVIFNFGIATLGGGRSKKGTVCVDDQDKLYYSATTC